MEFVKPPIHRKRCRRENLTGHAHFLTFSCFHRRLYLSRDRTRQWLIESIAHSMTQHRFDLWAYVIMPEHVHPHQHQITCSEEGGELRPPRIA